MISRRVPIDRVAEPYDAVDAPRLGRLVFGTDDSMAVDGGQRIFVVSHRVIPAQADDPMVRFIEDDEILFLRGDRKAGHAADHRRPIGRQRRRWSDQLSLDIEQAQWSGWRPL